ncbi:hypothetical protein AURDEDRAFT_163437, partial [Auricularia subglabra TFB-10046 SS5]
DSLGTEWTADVIRSAEASSELTQQCAAPGGDTPASGLPPPPITAPLSPSPPPATTSSTPRRTASHSYPDAVHTAVAVIAAVGD